MRTGRTNFGVRSFQSVSAVSVTRAEINTDRLRRNARAFMNAAQGDMRVMAVVKADAYGHGAVDCARVLQDAGVDWFAVATIGEAARLRESGFRAKLLVFAPPLPDQLSAYEQLDLELGVTSIALLEQIAIEQPHLLERTHLKVDTGMSRLGIATVEVAEAAAVIRRSSRTIRAVWTHMAHSSHAADPETVDQVTTFRTVLAEAGLSDVPRHTLATGAFCEHPSLRERGPSWCRIGIGLYGVSTCRTEPCATLEPVMRVMSRVLQVRRIERGAGVSYDHTWRAPRATRIATIGAGYADGIPRNVSGRASIGVPRLGRRCLIVGSVCMDMFMIDLGPGPDAKAVRAGDDVVLIGDGGPSVLEVAAWADSISYEICTGIGPRVPRVYVGDEVLTAH